MEKSERRKTITKRILIGVGIALVLSYIVFLFVTTNFLGSNNISTEITYRSTAEDVVKATGLIVRDEEYVSSSASGVLVYNVSDGDKVIADGDIATVYNNQQDVAALTRIEEIDEKIAFLESLGGASTTVNVGIDTINNQLNDKLIYLEKQINARAFDNISAAEDDLMTTIYRKQVITGQQGSLVEKIAALEAERESLRSSTGQPAGAIKAPAAGYFVSSVDGYEKSIGVDKLDRLTYSEFEQIEPAEVTDPSCVGKIIKGVNWYVVCPVSSDEAANISRNSDSISIRMPYAMTETIPAKLLYVNPGNGEDQTIVVLQCNYMNSSISRVRREPVEIVVNTYEGLKVSKKALHDDTVTRTNYDDDGNDIGTESRTVQGVYVEYGNELVFKQVDIKFSGDDYIICNETPAEGVLFNGSTITLYDKVVVEGGDLFDGKLIQ